MYASRREKAGKKWNSIILDTFRKYINRRNKREPPK